MKINTKKSRQNFQVKKLEFIITFRIPLFKELITYVLTFALSELLWQYEMVKSNTESPIWKTHLCCAHKIKCLKGEPLHLHDIHSQVET